MNDAERIRILPITKFYKKDGKNIDSQRRHTASN